MPLLSALTPRYRTALLDAGFFDWLTQPEVTSLLATCKTLRCDGAIATYALRRHRYARDFHSDHGFWNFGGYSANSWTAVPPFFGTEDMDEFSIGKELRAPNWFTFTDEPFENDSDLLLADGSSFATASADQRTKLLSLVGLMEKELVPFCGRMSDSSVGYFYAQPFLLPLDLPRDGYTDAMVHEQLEAINEGLGDIFFNKARLKTAIGMHWENMAVGREVRVQCVFCETVRHEIELFVQTAHAYWAARDERWRAEHARLVDAGVDRREASERVDEMFAERDKYYNKDTLHGHTDAQNRETVRWLYALGKLPRLNLLEHGDDQGVHDQLSAAVSGMPWKGFVCNTILKPLRHFFKRNGFRGVRRVRLPYVDQWAIGVRKPFETSSDDLSAVEWIGGVSPGGFLAGVYVVEETLGSRWI